MKYLLILLCTATLLACDAKKTSEEKEEAQNEVIAESESLAQAMLGEWRNVSLKVEQQTYKGSDSSSVFEVPKGKWEEILKIQPIRTTYTKDGNYRSEYWSLTDTLVRVSEGLWQVEGDSLVLIEGGVSSAYKTEIEDGVAKFTGYLDWDQDGAADDLYIGVQKKQ